MIILILRYCASTMPQRCYMFIVGCNLFHPYKNRYLWGNFIACSALGLHNNTKSCRNQLACTAKICSILLQSFYIFKTSLLSSSNLHFGHTYRTCLFNLLLQLDFFEVRNVENKR